MIKMKWSDIRPGDQLVYCYSDSNEFVIALLEPKLFISGQHSRWISLSKGKIIHSGGSSDLLIAQDVYVVLRKGIKIN